PNNVVHSVIVGLPLPVWNRNQGGIREAYANLTRANDEPARVRNELTTQLAAAFEKYDNARTLLLLYRDQMVPDQVRAYRALYRHYSTDPEKVNFIDVVVAQQTLSDTIKAYIDTITGVWDAVAEVANLLQIDDLY